MIDIHEPKESTLESWRKKLLDGIPAAITTAISALLLASGQLWITVRDHNHKISELESSLESLARCASQSECEQVRAILNAMDARLAVAETHVAAHERSADEWKQRIIENERELRGLMQSPAARPDPFTGTEGRELEQRIQQLERQR